MMQLDLPFDATAPKRLSPKEARIESIIQQEASNPIQDVKARGATIVFNTSAPRTLSVSGIAPLIHPHALAQICRRLRIPQAYLLRLLNTSLDNLAVHNLNTIINLEDYNTTFLLRTRKLLDSTDPHPYLLGFLTTSYMRLNTADLITSFVRACKEVGAQPFDGYSSDLQIAILAALPKAWEINGKTVRVGAVLEHSDFGARALSVRFFVRVAGLGVLIGKHGMRKVHRGTGGADTRQKITTDIAQMVIEHLENDRVEAVMAELRISAQTILNPDRMAAILGALPLNEDEVADAIRIASQQPTNSLYDLAVALSWVGATKPVDRQLAIAEMAGSLAMPARKQN